MGTFVRTIAVIAVLSAFSLSIAVAQETSEEAKLRGLREGEAARGRETTVRYQSAVENLRLVSAGTPGAGRPIVILSGQVGAADVAAIVEDIGVMSRIFDKALQEEFGEDYAPSATKTSFSWPLDQRGAQGMYLEGYGVVFLMSVGFPVVSPVAVAAENTEEKAESLWEQTKREMYFPPPAPPAMPGLHIMPRWDAPSRPARDDARNAEDLENTVLETLKHAANMRSLKPEETIAVAVFGGETTGASYVLDQRTPYGTPPAGVEGPVAPRLRMSIAPGAERPSRTTGEPPAGAMGAAAPMMEPAPAGRRRPAAPSPGETGVRPGMGPRMAPGAPLSPTGGVSRRVVVSFGPSRATVLTVHVRKADVDAFADGHLTFDEFRERATILAY